jgi:osmotically-inducible protein OsmY
VARNEAVRLCGRRRSTTNEDSIVIPTNTHWALTTIQRPAGSAETIEPFPATPSENATDLRLGADVDRALRVTGDLELRELQISADQGCVTLRGCVRTYYLKQLAQATTMAVAGAKSVDNQIVVP